MTMSFDVALEPRGFPNGPAQTDVVADGTRLDRTLLQILRCGAYELLARADVPVGTASGEYVDVAHAFFDQRDAKFVNGVLDAVAKAVRS